MTILICGSLAYDTIISFEGRFHDVISQDEQRRFNGAFLVPSLRKEFGGCAGNIAYNLQLLGADPLIMATIGKDGGPYLDRLATLGLTTRCIKTIENAYTAQAFITTDGRPDQITAFHPGAMSVSEENSVEQAGEVRIAIVAPDGRAGMINHARECAALGIPFVFDPGQGLPMFDGPALLELIGMATYVAVNEHEAEQLSNRTGKALNALAENLDALIVTRAENGADIFCADRKLTIPPVKATRVVDPTGCGDAFRAGLLVGISRGFEWETTGRLANLMGSLKIASEGGQNHQPSIKQIEDQFQSAFGYRLPLQN